MELSHPHNICVSVIMPVYNAAKYLEESINSILNQTFPHFELLLMDDGSHDSSPQIIKKQDDGRVRCFFNSRQMGIAKTLNRGIEHAQGKYIARMDADDIACPERLAKQVAFMEKHPEIGLCGTWFKMTGERKGIIKHPTQHADIMMALLKINPIGHPTAIIRKSILNNPEKVYNEDFKTSQDLELWTRLAPVTQLANIGEILLEYRVHPGQTSVEKLKQQSIDALNCRLTWFKNMLGNKGEHYTTALTLLLKGTPIESVSSTVWVRCLKCYRSLYLKNKRLKIFPEEQFIRWIISYWEQFKPHKIIRFSPVLLTGTLFPPFNRMFLLYKPANKIKFIVKCFTYRKNKYLATL